jgi:hypothetical protein
MNGEDCLFYTHNKNKYQHMDIASEGAVKYTFSCFLYGCISGVVCIFVSGKDLMLLLW